MAQAMIQKQKNMINSMCQTGSDGENEYYLTSNKRLKLYYSNVYKEKVISLNLSSSKNFIFTHKIWKKFRKLIPTIEDYFENDNDV
jgi:hypothetical protein